MLLRNLFKKYKDDSQFVSLFSCWLEHQQGPCRYEGPEQQESTKLLLAKESRCPTFMPHPQKKKRTKTTSENPRRDVKGRAGEVKLGQFSRIPPRLISFHILGLSVQLRWTPGLPSLVRHEFMERSFTGKREPFLYRFFFFFCGQLCVSVCLGHVYFFILFSPILLWKNTCEPCFNCCNGSLSALGTKKFLTEFCLVPIQIWDDCCRIYFCGDPKSAILK